MAQNAQVTLPEGMDKAAFDKLFQSFLKQRVSGKARNKASNKAKAELIAKHKDEYEQLVAKNMPKA